MTAAPSRTKPPAKGKGAWFAIAVLLLFYILSFVDRQILSLLVTPIEKDFKISDLEMGLLMGPAFGLFYVVCGLFMGRLVDSMPRRTVIALGVTVWGMATSLGGFARNYVALLLCRTGVGIGESVLTPAAHVLIAESFPPHKMSTAIGVYSSGVILGSSIALAVGGAVVHWTAHVTLNLPLIGVIQPWNLVLLTVGLITLAMLPVVMLLPRDEVGHVKPAAATAAVPGEAPPVTLGGLLRGQWRIFILVPLGFGCTNIIVNASFSWIPALLERNFHWTPGQIGSAFALQQLVCGLIGQIGGAMVADHLFARGIKDAHVRIQIWSLCFAIPLMAAGFLAGSGTLLLLLSAPFMLFCFPYLGYANAALQILTPSHLRGRVSAMFLAIVTALGTLLGAPIIGFFARHGGHGTAGLAIPLAALSVIAGVVAILTLSVAARALRAAHTAGGQGGS